MPINILVVDDNQTYLRSFCDLLQETFEHLQIVPVSDGSTALGLTHKIPFDLIILDYELNTVTGSDIVRRLWARGKPLPSIVMMSAQPDIGVFARVLKVNGFLQKPSSTEDLQRVIAPLIRTPAPRTTGPILWGAAG